MTETTPTCVLRGVLLFALLGSLQCGCGGDPGKKDPRTRLLAELASTTPETRLNAATQLGQMRERTAVPDLVTHLSDIRPDVRKASIVALGVIGDSRAVAPLCGVVSDETADRDLRRAAADALGAIRDPGAVQALAAALRCEDDGVVFSAAYAMANIGAPSLDALSEAVEKGQPHTKRAAATALGRIPGERSCAAMRLLLDANDPLLRLAAAENLGRIGDTARVDRIVSLLLDGDETVRLGMPNVIVNLGPAAADPLASILLIGTDAVDRQDAKGKTVRVPVAPARHAARGMITRVDGVPVIRPLVRAIALAESDEALQAHLMRQLSLKEGREELLRLCDSGSPRERAASIDAMSGFLLSKCPPGVAVGERKAALVKAGFAETDLFALCMAKASADPSEDVKYAACLALCRLGDAAGVPEVLAGLLRAMESIRSRSGPKKEIPGSDRSVISAKESLDALYPLADKAIADKLVPVLAESGLGGEWESIMVRVVRTLGKVADPAYADSIAPVLKNVRGFGPDSLGPTVCLALGAMGVKNSFDPILAYMKRLPNDNFFALHRVPIYEGLLGCDRDRGIEVVGEILVNMKPHIVGQIDGIATVFGKYPGRGAVRPLVRWIDHDIQSTADKVSRALTSIGRRDVSWLLDGFEIESSSCRCALAGLIADQFATNALPALLKAAGDKSARMRQGVVWTLGSIGSVSNIAPAVRETLLPPIAAGLKDEHFAVRSASVWSAGMMGDSSFVEPLVALAADKEVTVRSMVAEQLSQFRDGRVVKTLVGLLDDTEPGVAGRAAISLGKLKATEAVADLERLRQSKHPNVQAAAEAALAVIRAR